MVTVACNKEHCLYNNEGYCEAQVIELDSDGVCVEFERYK